MDRQACIRFCLADNFLQNYQPLGDRTLSRSSGLSKDPLRAWCLWKGSAEAANGDKQGLEKLVQELLQLTTWPASF